MCGDERTWAEALLSEKHIGWAGRRSGRVRPTLKADPKLKYVTVISWPTATCILDNRCLGPDLQILVGLYGGCIHPEPKHFRGLTARDRHN